MPALDEQPFQHSAVGQHLGAGISFVNSLAIIKASPKKFSAAVVEDLIVKMTAELGRP